MVSDVVVIGDKEQVWVMMMVVGFDFKDIEEVWFIVYL